MPLSEQELREEAKKRVGFKSHFLSFVIIIPFLWLLWYLTSPNSYMWPLWPTLGWAVGLAFHYAGVYHMSSVFSVEKEMQKMRDEGK